MAQQFFYDKQIRRYIQQFIRLFGGFSVQMGYTDDRLPLFQQVPVRYGDINRMAAHITRENSENIVNTVPFISCYVTDLNMAPERRMDQTHVDKVQVREKKYDENSGTYLNEIGNTYTIERHMPVPYNLVMNCDIWTSNTDQKLQLLEQIMVLFNPTLNIRTSNNAFDWTAFGYVEMTNSIWSSRSVQSNIDDIIDVSTLTFTIPILITPPAKVKQQRIIHTIINQLETLTDDELSNLEGLPVNAENVNYILTTFEDMKLKFADDRAYLLSSVGSNYDSEGNLLEWKKYLSNFGELRDGISQIRLRKSNNPGSLDNDIIGRLMIDDSNPNALIVDVDQDTLPTNTLQPINGVVNPQNNYPGDGSVPPATLGDRWMITNSTPSIWGVEADVNDIIEYNGSSWNVSFDSSSVDSKNYVLNLKSNDQLEWSGEEWVNSHEGIYNAGYWRLYL